MPTPPRRHEVGLAALLPLSALRLVEEHLAKASDFLDRPESVQYFGRRSERLTEAMAPYEPGSVATFPEHVAGFVRSADAEGAGP